MIVELLILVFLLVCLRFFVFKSKAERIYDSIPGPKPYPIIGNMLEFDYPRVEVTETLKRLSFQYGPVNLVRFGLEKVLCLRRPSDIEEILGSTTIIDKAPLYWPLLPWLNQGLLTSKGELWKNHRKIITPAFHFNILEKFVPVFVKNTKIFVEKLSKNIGKDVDIMPAIASCSLDIISETAMGLEVNAQQKESKYMKALNELLEIIAHRNFNLIDRTFLFHLKSNGRRHKNLITYLHRVTENIILERRAKLEDNPDEGSIDAEADLGIKKKKAFLDLLLEYSADGALMSDTEIREEVDTFMFEGYDTTTSTMSFCLYCLSQNQDAQNKVYEEIKEIFGNSERDLTYQDLQAMKYLEKVIKETLRLYPAVQFIARQLNKELTLKSGFTIPVNTSILILIEAMHIDPDLYPEPSKFIPERWDNKTSNPYAFIPFSAGPRNCIGQKYAMLEIKALVSQVLRKFCLLPSAVPITPWFTIVLKSKTGVHLQIQHRTNT